MAIRDNARFIAGLLLVVPVAIQSYVSEARDAAMGKEAFLADAARRFDLYYAHPSYLSRILVAVFMVGGLLGLYEALSKFIGKAGQSADASKGT
jgi:uncharacterized membrane protein